MKLRRILFESGNAVLRPLGLHLGRLEGDFQTSVPKGTLHDMILASLTDVWGRWYDTMATDRSVGHTPSISRAEFTSRILTFLREYRAFTEKNMRSGGLLLNNTISLFAAATYFDAPTIIDSGTYTGNSAWALSRACPRAVIHSFDITHIALRHREPNVTYHLGDWAGIVKEPLFGPAAFGFFDDHVDQVRRVEECAARNIRYLVFDDDNPVNATHYGHNPKSFPKISFVYSETLRNVSQLEWSWLGREIAVDVDHERLDRARSHIAHYSRLPDLFATTGFKQQWPLSVVVLRAADAMHPVRDSSGSA
jgi:hypothetical protein